MDGLIENAVIEWSADELQPKYVERILWIDPVRDKVISIVLGDEKAIPQSKTLSEMVSGIQSNKCKPIVWVDNRIPLILDENIAPKSLEIRRRSNCMRNGTTPCMKLQTKSLRRIMSLKK